MNLNLNNSPAPLVEKAEEDQVSRNVLRWLNEYPDIPFIEYETLEASATSMALSTIPGTYITSWDIVGNYEAEYQFKVIYRLKPSNMTKKLEADELLDALGDWASLQPIAESLDLGPGRTASRVNILSRSSLFAPYPNGYEDHQIIMRLTYSVSI